LQYNLFKMNKIIGIYKITNLINDAIYIGQSKNIEFRFKSYKKLQCKTQSKLYNSLNKFGIENHTFEIIKEGLESEINYYERYYQEYYNVLDREYGLNLKYTGIGDKKVIHSEETRKKIGAKNKGKKISDEQRKKISEIHKGKKQSKEHIDKRKRFGKDNHFFGNKYWKGKKFSQERIKQMSEQRKGKNKLGENPNAKKVINIETGEIYNSAKEISIKYSLNYSTLKSYLNGNLKNKTNFKYIN